jgi:DNA-directed RNA polymerase subunit omega
MIDPSIVSLLDKVDSRYSLVVVVSKRARQIIAGEKKLTDYDSNKPVTIAIHELNEGKIVYEKIKPSMR